MKNTLDNRNEQNVESLKNIDNTKIFIKLISNNKIDAIPKKLKELNIILEEDEEKLKKSTKRGFFNEQINHENTEKKIENYFEKPDEISKFSNIWDNPIFFPPIIDTSVISAKNENSSVSKDLNIESLSDYNNSKLLTKNNNISSNETSTASYITKNKNIKSLLKVDINLGNILNTPNKDSILTPKEDYSSLKEENQNNLIKKFNFNEELINHSGLKTAKQDKYIQFTPGNTIISKKLKEENNKLRPKSVVVSPIREIKKLKLKNSDKKKNNQNLTSRESSSKNIVKLDKKTEFKSGNLPILKPLNNFNIDLDKIISACREYKEDIMTAPNIQIGFKNNTEDNCVKKFRNFETVNKNKFNVNLLRNIEVGKLLTATSKGPVKIGGKDGKMIKTFKKK